MLTLISDRNVSDELIQQRQETGSDRWDEVWEGVYVVMPFPNDEHQDLALGLGSHLRSLIQETGLGQVRPGINLSDRIEDWTSNYRGPDVVVFLAGSPAENHGTFWCGPPDFVIEIISPDDRAREKFDFYESIGTRELLLIDRDPWRLELYRLADGTLAAAGVSSPSEPMELSSEVIPISLRLVEGADRPQIEIASLDGESRWTV